MYDFETNGVFVYIGMLPLNDPFTELGITDEEGYIPTSENMETKIPGILQLEISVQKILDKLLPLLVMEVSQLKQPLNM